MPLTSYTAGDVLTAASLNNNFTFAAANPTGGLSFVSGAAFTSVTSVNLTANTFSSTYRNYRIVLHITAAASATAATMRLRAAGADLTTSDYRYASVGLSSTNTANNFVGNATSSWQILDTNTDPQPTVMVVDLVAPQLATQTLITGTFVASNGTYSLLMQAFSGRFTLTTVADAASFLFAGATTGVYRIYGYLDS